MEYAKILPAVEKHEGTHGRTDIVSHYQFWHVDALKKDTDHDPAVKVERLTKPPGTTKKEFVKYVASKIEEYFTEVNRIWQKEIDRVKLQGFEDVPDYLPAGKRIDWTYPD